MKVAVKDLNVSLNISPALLEDYEPQGVELRTILYIEVAGRILSADLAGRSVRNAVQRIRKLGTDNVKVVLQGRLMADGSLSGAGLSATPLVRKSAQSADAEPPVDEAA